MNDTVTTEPRPRAIFSTEDFGLIRDAVAAYIRQLGDDPLAAKYVSLHHRLGRALPRG